MEASSVFSLQGGRTSQAREASGPTRPTVLLVALATLTVLIPSAIAGGASGPPAGVTTVPGQPGVDAVEDGELSPLIREIPRDVYESLDVVDPETSPTAFPPTIERTIRPGRQIVTDIPGEGTFSCTANFIYKDTDTGDPYLGTAGHCVLPTGVNDTKEEGFREPEVLVCSRFCAGGSVTGTVSQYVELGDVLYARQAENGEVLGHDYAFIEIPDRNEDFVEPQIPFWQGPKNERSSVQFGEQVTIYGQGLGFGDAEADTRTGMALGEGINGPEGSYAAAIPTISGDSGGPVMTDIHPLNPSTGTSEALGALTHGLGIGGVPIVGLGFGTLSEQAVAFTEAETGVQLDLVTAEDHFPQ